MDIKELEKLQNEGNENLSSSERRTFLKAGLAITGVFMGGTVLSLTSAGKSLAKVSTESNGCSCIPLQPALLDGNAPEPLH